VSARARKSAALSIPLLLLCAAWLAVGPPKTSPAAAAAPDDDRIDAAEAAKVYEPPRTFMPEAARPTGGPYLDAETIRLKGLSEAVGRGAREPQTQSVRFMTYGEATEWYGTSRSTQVDLYREVYVVYVPGRITVGHHTLRTLDNSYYVYDASTGRLIQFGATDLPDPLATGQPYPR